MDGPARPAAISRIDSRYRYQSQPPPVPDEHHPHEHLVQARRDARPRSRERMTRSHRVFHRRQALGDPEVVTVEVVNEVDQLGNVVAQETRTTVLPNVIPTTVALPLPDASLPAVPSVSVVPDVPAPALPSVQVPAVPAVPVPAPSAAPVPALPTVLPSVPTPELPPVPAPELPSVPAPVPELPSVPAAELPSVPVPELPAVPAPTLPSAPVPALPSVPVPTLPSVPSVPAPPSVPVPVLPSVPAVPPFPTSLQVPSVPAYPFPSMFPVAHAVSASDSASDSASASASALPVPAPVSAINSAMNMTLSSTATLLPSSSLASLDSISASEPTDLMVSIQAVPTALASDMQYLPSSVIASFTQTLITSHSARSTSTTSKPATTSKPVTTTTYSSSEGGGVPGVGGVPVATTSATSEAGADSSPSALETPKVIGSVLGSLAGAALILALILLLLRRHKQRRGGALQLTGDEHAGNQRSMSQAPTATSAFVPVAFLNRFSGMSGKTVETNSSGGQRSFQRVSGRKLPSAFSEGMTSDQFAGGGTMSGSSFYQDDHGIYGGPGMSKEFGKEIGDTSATRDSGQMNIRPSPARTPIIRHPDDGNPFADHHHLSPPHSPVAELPPRGTLGRSLPSADGSRSSKFTENV